MKILACTDGSEHSQKALEVASAIAQGPNVDEVAIIFVYDQRHDSVPPITTEGSSSEQIEREWENFRKITEEHKKERKKILPEALKLFKGKNIKTRTIYREGHPSYTIAKVAQEEGFDMIVIGSRGLGGFKKLFLGSVSNAIIQEVENCSVLVVK